MCHCVMLIHKLGFALLKGHLVLTTSKRWWRACGSITQNFHLGCTDSACARVAVKGCMCGSLCICRGPEVKMPRSFYNKHIMKTLKMLCYWDASIISPHTHKLPPLPWSQELETDTSSQPTPCKHQKPLWMLLSLNVTRKTILSLDLNTKCEGRRYFNSCFWQGLV